MPHRFSEWKTGLFMTHNSPHSSRLIAMQQTAAKSRENGCPPALPRLGMVAIRRYFQ